MRYAVINPETKEVENIIIAESSIIVKNGSGMQIVESEDLNVNNKDLYNAADGKFYRGGTEVSKIPTVEEQVRAAIDKYTLELVRGGKL